MTSTTKATSSTSTTWTSNKRLTVATATAAAATLATTATATVLAPNTIIIPSTNVHVPSSSIPDWYQSSSNRKIPTSTTTVTTTTTTATGIWGIPRGGGLNHNNNNNNNNDSENGTRDTNDTTTTEADSTNHHAKASSKQQQHSKSNNHNNKSSSKNHTPQRNPTGSSKQSTPTSTIPMDILQHADDYYYVLGISKDATETQITKAYRRRAVVTHPDKTGGDRRAFDIVAEAYDVLSSKEQRWIYDRYGKEGLSSSSSSSFMHQQQQQHPHGGGGGLFFSDLFRDVFSHSPYQRHGQSSSSQSSPQRNFPMRYQIQIPLEELYTGTRRDIVVGMPTANGKMKKKQSKTIQVDIPAGTISGHVIVMSGEIDFMAPNASPADLIFVVTEAPHPIYTRKHYDLAMEMTISLEESICGIQQRSITLLDGSVIHIESATTTTTNAPATTTTTTTTTTREKKMKHAKKKKKNDNNDNYLMDDDNVAVDNDTSPIVIQTGDVQVLRGKGFPKPHSNGEMPSFGDLYIQFRVEPIQIPTNGATRRSNTKNNNNNNHPPLHPLSLQERQQLGYLLAKLQGKEPPDHATTISQQQSENVDDDDDDDEKAEEGAPGGVNENVQSSPKQRRQRRRRSLSTTTNQDENDDKKGTTSKAATTTTASKPEFKTNNNNNNKIPVYRLEPAMASEFGRTSGIPKPEQHQFHHQQDGEDDPFQQSHDYGHPFGTGTSTFSTSKRFYFGSTGNSGFHPFGNNDDDEGHVQCNQM